MRISNSKAKTYRRCPKKYEYKYVLKLRPRAKALPLELGSWLHSLLEAYYDGESWKKRHKELLKKFYNIPEEVREEIQDLPDEALRIMRSYLRRYEAEDARRYRIVDSEMDEFVMLPNGLQLQIIVDLILEDVIDGGLWLMDHKFRKNLADPDDQILDPQLTLYYWGLEKLGYVDLRGAIYNEVRTKLPTEPKVLVSGGLSRAKNIDTDVYTYMRALKRNNLDIEPYAETLALIATREPGRFFERTSIPKDPPVIKTALRELVQTAQEIQTAEQKHRFPRTFDSSCKWGCEMKALCIPELHGADINSIIRQSYEVSRRGKDQ